MVREANITTCNGEEINPDFVYMIVPAEYVCTYHKLLVLLSDFGIEMLNDCNAGCKGKNKNIVNCWNMFQTACAAYQIGNTRQANVIINYIKETINSIYRGTDINQVTDIILPISVDGEVKAVITCGNNPTFRPDQPNGNNGDCDCVDVVQTTGSSSEDVMSQSAVTRELNDLKGEIITNHLEIYTTVNKNIIEKGVNENILLSWNITYKNENIVPDSIEIKVNNVVIATNPETNSINYTISNTTNFEIKVTYNGFVKTKIVEIGAYYPMYFENINKELISFSDIQNLSTSDKIIRESPKGTISVNFETEGYLWIIIPIDMTINKIISNGYAVPMNNEITITSSNNVSYKCYRSVNKFNPGLFNAIIF